MIFNEDFDNALWLLVSNKTDGSKIGEIISFIPDFVYDEIQVVLDNYFNNKLAVKDDILYQKSLNNIGGYDCYIKVGVISNKLYLDLLRWVDGKNRVEEEYKLILRKIGYDDLFNIKNEVKLGRFIKDIYNIDKYNGEYLIDNLATDHRYTLRKAPLGFIITSYGNKFPISKKYVDVVKNMPDELFAKDLKKESLVKKRKR